LFQDVEVHERGVAQRLAGSSDPEGGHAERPRRLAPASREHGAHLFAVLVAERRRIQMENKVIELHQASALFYARPGAKPFARAIRTSCVNRRASAFATAVPSAVIR